MTKTHSSIATDSETELRDLIGDDATATFEDDPKFIESNPGAEASSENVAVQRDTDDAEEDDEDEDEDEDEEDEDEDDEEDEDEEDEEDEDEDDVEDGVEEDSVDVDEMDTDRVVAA
jgi:hypothetical protein